MATPFERMEEAAIHRAWLRLDEECPLPLRWEFEQLKAEALRRLVTDIGGTAAPREESER